MISTDELRTVSSLDLFFFVCRMHRHPYPSCSIIYGLFHLGIQSFTIAFSSWHTHAELLREAILSHLYASFLFCLFGFCLVDEAFSCLKANMSGKDVTLPQIEAMLRMFAAGAVDRSSEAVRSMAEEADRLNGLLTMSCSSRRSKLSNKNARTYSGRITTSMLV